MADLNRYDRQIKLSEVGLEGQQKIHQAKVLIIGLGGLGCPAAQYLAASGVGHLGLIDHDVVNITNLHRQILYAEKDVGQPKVIVAKSALEALNSEIKVTAYVEPLTVENAVALIAKYDIVLDGTDNFQTKYLINDACVLADKPFVGASIYKYQGQLSVFNFRGGPSYRCLYPHHHLTDNNNCEETGVLGVLPGILGAMQATETLKMILDIGAVLHGKLKFIDVLTQSDQTILFERSEEQIKFIKDRPLQLERIICELKEKNKIYLDVREVFEQPRIEDKQVIHIPVSQLTERLDAIPTNEKVYVFCQSGRRSKKAVAYLTETHGFDNLLDAGSVESILK